MWEIGWIEIIGSLMLFVQSGEMIFHEYVILIDDGVLRLSAEKGFEVLALLKVNIYLISFIVPLSPVIYRNIYPSFSNIVYPSFFWEHHLNFYASRIYLIFSRVFLFPNEDVQIQDSQEVVKNKTMYYHNCKTSGSICSRPLSTSNESQIWRTEGLRGLQT